MTTVAPRIDDYEVSVLLADPPWKFGDGLPGKSRGAAKNYSVLTVQEIMRFPLPRFTESAILFLWRVSSMQAEALKVVDAWGFTVKSEIVWGKFRASGKPWFGMGRYVRAAHETCLVCTRGRYKVASRSVPSRFSARVPLAPDGSHLHSGKPPEFYEIVERLTHPGEAKMELFARKARPGWVSFGEAGLLVPGP